jgi:hypothetical protein|uniref:Uncharacterized protein n=1 Tax=Siphoviridae sp. cttU829 TaxID=2823605 RepID=A0A8S5LCD0_9CAUD|nr:MAG TPA: hypothetical protein [Siphoviridae sp. cttU829]
MTIDAAIMLVDELRGRFDAPFNQADKDAIERTYKAVIGRTFVQTSCQQCYHDAVLEIYHYIKKYGKMAEVKKYNLKAGAIINCPNFQEGKVFSNENLTDEIAAEYLKEYPDQVGLFETYKTPEDGETPEDGDAAKGNKGKK